VIEHVHVEFTLFREAGEGEVTGTEKSGDGIIRIGAETEVELGV
jgi:hypothetical protein